MDDDESINGAEQQVNGTESGSLTNGDAPVVPTTDGGAPNGNIPSTRNSALLTRRQGTNPESPELTSFSAAIDMPPRTDSNHLDPARTQTPDADRLINGEGPLTPRNDVGPFILDGSAGRRATSRVAALAEVTEGDSTS